MISPKRKRIKLNLFNRIRDNAFSFLFADLCYFCRKEHVSEGENICAPCCERMSFIREPFCTTCGKPFVAENDTSHTCGECIVEARHYDRARSIFRYDNIIRQTIIRYKFIRDVTLAKAFSRYISDYINDELNNGYDTVIPVPLHRRRLRERHFNQAALILGEVETRNQIRVDKYCLKRIKYTTPQVMLTGRARIKNVKGAFSVIDGYNINKKRVLVVDDIYTTGATVDECAFVLMAAGAEKVDVLTLAKSVDVR